VAILSLEEALMSCAKVTEVGERDERIAVEKQRIGDQSKNTEISNLYKEVASRQSPAVESGDGERGDGIGYYEYS
jgi:hypothetical protein